jgi:hypothetical protein
MQLGVDRRGPQQDPHLPIASSRIRTCRQGARAAGTGEGDGESTMMRRLPLLVVSLLPPLVRESSWLGHHPGGARVVMTD